MLNIEFLDIYSEISAIATKIIEYSKETDVCYQITKTLNT